MMTKLYVQAKSRLMALRKNSNGQTLVEYALILALVSIVVIAVLTILGEAVEETFSAVAEEL